MITSIGQIIALCVQMTNLKLDASCGFDRTFAQKWYENEYLTGKHTRYVMKPNLTINSFEDGEVYRAFNCDDAKAVEFMEKDPAYRDYFIDLQAESDAEPEENPAPLPELEEDGGGIKAEPEPEPEENPAPLPELEEDGGGIKAEPEPEPEENPAELSDEEAAALKRSEAAKKAAATRAAKKAAEAAALEAAKLAEFEGE